MTGTENRPGKKARSLSRKRIQEKRECWCWGYIKIHSYPPGSASSLPFFSSCLSMALTSLSLWPCIFMSLFPPLGLPTAIIHPSKALYRSPPPSPAWDLHGSLLPRWGTGPSFSSGSSLNKRDQWVLQKQSCIWCDVRRPCHQRHQMSPDFFRVFRNPPLSLSISPWPNEPQLQLLRLLDNSSRVKRDSSQGAGASF